MAYICVHAHVYLPLRENPWLEAVEFQDSAYPSHDWYERETIECYVSNAASQSERGLSISNPWATRSRFESANGPDRGRIGVVAISAANFVRPTGSFSWPIL